MHLNTVSQTYAQTDRQSQVTGTHTFKHQHRHTEINAQTMTDTDTHSPTQGDREKQQLTEEDTGIPLPGTCILQRQQVLFSLGSRVEVQVLGAHFLQV